MNSITERLERFEWLNGTTTTKYERLKSGVATLNPWKRRLLYMLPPILVLSWLVYLFNPFVNVIPTTQQTDDSALAADIIPPTVALSEQLIQTATNIQSAPTVTQTVYVPAKDVYNETKVAFLMETRNIPHLAPLLLHMINVVPHDWKFRFMGSPESIAFINSSLPIQRYEKIGKLDMVLVPDNVTYKGQQELSETFTDLWWYETVLAPAKWLLVFQTDSIMCANSGKDLNDWLHYDWVGAPWAKNAAYGGNGGLSLRRVQPIIDLLKKKSRPKGDPELEDLWLSNNLAKEPGAVMATGTQEEEFSVESVWRERPMGYHTGWSGAYLPGDVWGTPEKRKHIFDYCPEMKITLNMKLEREGCENPPTKRGLDGEELKFFVRAW